MRKPARTASALGSVLIALAAVLLTSRAVGYPASQQRPEIAQTLDAKRLVIAKSQVEIRRVAQRMLLR
jgi:hypothetical protein